MKQLWIYAVVALVVGGILYAAPRSESRTKVAADFEDLEPCAVLTSLDSKKSLRLSSDHRAVFSDQSGLSNRTTHGNWSRVYEAPNVYRVSLDGRAQDYTLASAPAGEGCMLAAGRLDAVDLGKSWFSANIEPD